MHIIASDFDGTLNRKGKVSDEDKRAIERFRAAGNLFGLATGRTRSLLEWVRDKYDLTFDFVLANNGALAVDGEGNIIYDVRGENRDDLIYKLALYINEKYGHGLNYSLGYEFISYHAAYPDGNETYHPLSEIHSIKEFNMLATTVPSDQIVECVEELRRIYGDVINPLYNGIYLDIPPAGMDKGVGVARYAEIMGVPHENIYTVGDSMNDAAMITRFKGHAIADGFRDLVDIAPYTCESVSDLIKKIIGE